MIAQAEDTTVQPGPGSAGLDSAPLGLELPLELLVIPLVLGHVS
jgi:hypothetical protein